MHLIIFFEGCPKQRGECEPPNHYDQRCNREYCHRSPRIKGRWSAMQWPLGSNGFKTKTIATFADTPFVRRGTLDHARVKA
jgi:hypothetical protein